MASTLALTLTLTIVITLNPFSAHGSSEDKSEPDFVFASGKQQQSKNFPYAGIEAQKALERFLSSEEGTSWSCYVTYVLKEDCRGDYIGE